VGQKNDITRRWARRGTRPWAPQDQRYASTYIFGAICPRDGRGAALVLPLCNTAATNLHLAEISSMVTRSVPKCSHSKYGFRASGVRTEARANRAKTGL